MQITVAWIIASMAIYVMDLITRNMNLYVDVIAPVGNIANHSTADVVKVANIFTSLNP
jgi:hypothetical protein